jgi:hypothetical protein
VSAIGAALSLKELSRRPPPKESSPKLALLGGPELDRNAGVRNSQAVGGDEKLGADFDRPEGEVTVPPTLREPTVEAPPTFRDPRVEEPLTARLPPTEAAPVVAQAGAVATLLEKTRP